MSVDVVLGVGFVIEVERVSNIDFTFARHEQAQVKLSLTN
jgi:hypothetical protein